MTGPAQPQPLCHKASEVAVMLGISQWWIKEQARHGRIPYTWLGGSYRFTTEHIAEIVRLFEVRPTEPTTTAAVVRLTPRSTTAPRDSGPPTLLRARRPRRTRDTMPQSTAA